MQNQNPRHGYKLVKSLFGKYEEIPQYWQFEKLLNNSILKGRIGWQGLTTSEYRPQGEFYLVTGTEFQNGKIDWKACVFVDKDRYVQDPNIQLKKGDVLVTKDGTIGKVAFVDVLPRPATLNSGIFVIRPKDNSVLPLFLFYILNSRFFVKFLNRLQAGSTINHLYQKDFVNFSFPIPPIEEQQKIASILSRADDLIQKTAEVIEQTERLRKGLLQRLLTRGIGHTQFKKARFNSHYLTYEIPIEWRIDAIKNVSTKLVVSYVGVCDPYYTDESGIPMIRTTNVREGRLDLSNLKYVTREFHEKNKKSQLKQNDLLVARHGENGEACLFRGLGEANCLSCVIIRPDPELWAPEFFEIAFNFSIVRNQIARSTGGGVQTVVNTSEIGKVLIPVPSIQEQSRITSIISSVSSDLQNSRERLNELFKLKNGLVQKLLTGQIRVKV